MKEQFFEYDSDIRIDKYLKEIFQEAGVSYRCERDKRITKITFFATDELKESIVCGIVINFFKLKTILSILPRMDTPAYYSLLGATLAVEGEEDLMRIKSKAADAVYLNGFCNFCLTEVIGSWKNLAEITAKLLDRCQSEEDIYALSIFMLGIDESVSASIEVDNGLNWEDGGKIVIVPYFDDEIKDTVVTLVSNRPSDVVVPDKSKVDPFVLSVIRSLGEGGK